MATYVPATQAANWIEQHWDHTMIICHEDVELLSALKPFEATKPIFMAPFNPTAENIAAPTASISAVVACRRVEPDTAIGPVSRANERTFGLSMIRPLI